MGLRWTDGGDGILVGRCVDSMIWSPPKGGGDVGSMEFGGDEFGNLEKCLRRQRLAGALLCCFINSVIQRFRVPKRRNYGSI
jgi:hypothetical protein